MRSEEIEHEFSVLTAEGAMLGGLRNFRGILRFCLGRIFLGLNDSEVYSLWRQLGPFNVNLAAILGFI